MELGSSDILIIASVGVIGVVFAMWRLLYVPARSEADSFLTDGAVLLLSDGLVQQASVEARDLLGSCEQKPIVLVLSEFLREESADARDAVNRLEMTGDPVNMLVYDRDDRAFELIGAPAGGMIRLILRDAGFLDTRLKAVEERLSAADAMVQSRNWERVTLRSLISEAPIIVWNRSAEGQIHWADGEIRTRDAVVTADQAVDLIVARTKLNTQPSLVGEPQKSRIEIVLNEESDSVALQVIEVVRTNGDRIGFATDAGTAASAERTLTRFVQTMTETFAHLTVGLAIFDRNQTLALFNPALVQMWQLEPSWLARRPSLRDIVDELRASRRLPELQDFHKWRAELVGLFDNTEAADYEELWHLSNGSNIRVLARPHPHGSLAFIFDDVTERMRLEQRYRHSIDLRRVSLDRLNEGVAVFGSNGLLQFINQAFHEIWGTNSETVYAAMHIRQFIPLCQQLAHEHDIWKHLHSFVTGEEHRREWEAKITTLCGYILNARFVPLPDGSTMAVFTNITDSRLASVNFSEKSFSLRFALAVRDHVVSETARQIRAPLLDLAQRVQSADGDRKALGNDIRQAIATLDNLTEFSQLSEKTSETTEQMALSTVLETTGQLLQSTAQRTGVEVTVGDSASAAQVGVPALTYHRICFALGLFAIEKCRPDCGVEMSFEYEESGFRLVAVVQTTPEITSREGAFVQDRALLEHLVAQEGGVLSILETQANGTFKIIACFDPDNPDRNRDTDGSSFAEDEAASNVLQLPASGTSD